jgi:hypothetical protein
MTSLLSYINNIELRQIADKIIAGIRINPEEGLILFNKADLSLLGILSGLTRRRINGITAVSAHIINRPAILKAGNTVTMRCLRWSGGSTIRM